MSETTATDFSTMSVMEILEANGAPAAETTEAETEAQESDASDATAEPETEEKADGEAEGESDEESEGEDDQPEVVDSLLFGEEELPLAAAQDKLAEYAGIAPGLDALVDKYKEYEIDRPTLVNAAGKHLEFLTRMGTEAGHAEVIGEIAGAWFAQYGPDGEAPADFNFAKIDPAGLTPSEQLLYRAAVGLATSYRELHALHQQTVSVAKEATTEALTIKRAAIEAQELNQKHPHARMTGEKVLALKEKHGVSDAGKAYILELAETGRLVTPEAVDSAKSTREQADAKKPKGAATAIPDGGAGEKEFVIKADTDIMDIVQHNQAQRQQTG